MTASGHGARPGADASGHWHMGTGDGRRSASTPRGTGRGLGRITSGPHVARRGPKAATGTVVTASVRGDRGEDRNGHVQETANGPWR